MCVCWDYCVLSGRGLCIGPITRPGENHRVSECVCVWVWVTEYNQGQGQSPFPQISYFVEHVLLPLLKTIYFCVHSCNLLLKNNHTYWKFHKFTKKGWYQRFHSNSCYGVDPFWEARQLDSSQKSPAFYVTPNFNDVLTINSDGTSLNPYKIYDFFINSSF